MKTNDAPNQCLMNGNTRHHPLMAFFMLDNRDGRIGAAIPFFEKQASIDLNRFNPSGADQGGRNGKDAKRAEKQYLCPVAGCTCGCFDQPAKNQKPPMVPAHLEP